MSQVLRIDESNKLIGYLNDHQREKLRSCLMFVGKNTHGQERFTSPLFPLTIVMDKHKAWQCPWFEGSLYLQCDSWTDYSYPKIPDDTISHARKTITRINAILAFDCKLTYQLRIFDSAIKASH